MHLCEWYSGSISFMAHHILSSAKHIDFFSVVADCCLLQAVAARSQTRINKYFPKISFSHFTCVTSFLFFIFIYLFSVSFAIVHVSHIHTHKAQTPNVHTCILLSSHLFQHVDWFSDFNGRRRNSMTLRAELLPVSLNALASKIDGVVAEMIGVSWS